MGNKQGMPVFTAKTQRAAGCFYQEYLAALREEQGTLT